MEKAIKLVDENFGLSFWGFFIVNTLIGELNFDALPMGIVFALLFVLIFCLVVLWRAASLRNNKWRIAVKVYIGFQILSFFAGVLIGLGVI